jgi:hypothetical protein
LKKTFLILLQLFLFQVFGQNSDGVKYQFAKEVFKKEYKKTTFESFKGEIERLNENELKFKDKVLKIYSNDTSLIKIFSKGIFNPEIIFGKESTKILTKNELDSLSTNKKIFYNLTRNDSLTIGNLEGLEKLNPNFKTKRFMFWLFRIGIANPQECYFELQNEKGNKDMKMEEFIENAKVTFFYQGTIIL